MLGVSSDLGNSAIRNFESVGTVCPPSLNIGVFTTSAVDNTDHDPSAISAQRSFHGKIVALKAAEDSLCERTVAMYNALQLWQL